MSANRQGGLKAAATNKANDPDFYKKIGKKGGQNSKRPLTTEEARRIGKLGGRPKHSYR